MYQEGICVDTHAADQQATLELMVETGRAIICHCMEDRRGNYSNPPQFNCECLNN